MIDHIVFDVEIAKTIEEVGGWHHTEKMGVAVACVWQYRNNRLSVYGPDDVDALRNRLLSADRISSYNGLLFDYPVVWGYSKAEWKASREDLGASKGAPAIYKQILPKTDDMLRRIWQAKGLDPDRFNPRTHGGTKLDDVAYNTLGVRKIGNGADAPKWYQEGKIQQVVNYCADDVAIERDLTDFVDRYGYVVLPSGEKLPIPQWKGQ